MVNFYPPFVNCSPNATLSQVAGNYECNQAWENQPCVHKNQKHFLFLDNIATLIYFSFARIVKKT